MDVVWGLPRCVWARESTAPAQGNQSLSRELRASALGPGLEARFPARRREEKGMTENEMVGWHHQLNGHESEQAPEVGVGQGGLACYSPWGHKESDMTERLNRTEMR